MKKSWPLPVLIAVLLASAFWLIPLHPSASAEETEVSALSRPEEGIDGETMDYLRAMEVLRNTDFPRYSRILESMTDSGYEEYYRMHAYYLENGLYEKGSLTPFAYIDGRVLSGEEIFPMIRDGKPVLPDKLMFLAEPEGEEAFYLYPDSPGLECRISGDFLKFIYTGRDGSRYTGTLYAVQEEIRPSRADPDSKGRAGNDPERSLF